MKRQIIIISIISIYVIAWKQEGERLSNKFEKGRLTIYFSDKYTEDEIKRLADQLIAREKYFSVFLPELTPQHDFTCQIKIYDDTEHLKKHIRSGAYGTYIPWEKTLHATLQINDKSPIPRILFHEMFHYYFDRVYDWMNMPKRPNWINEGLADYLGSIEADVENKTLKMFHKSVKRLQTIRELINKKKYVGLKYILEDRRLYDYSHYWSLCCFLLEYSDGEDNRYRKFFSYILEGLKAQDAGYYKILNEALLKYEINIEQMENEWKKFMLEYKYDSARYIELPKAQS